jgi:pimeloyl-ACP methyl ester carboxylesterase
MNAKSRTISATDGRQIRIIEAGQPDGIPVLVQHGTPGSRLLYDPWVEDAAARGIRLISYERPGYGGSTPQPGRNVAGAAGDVAAIARELNFEPLIGLGNFGRRPACPGLRGLIA